VALSNLHLCGPVAIGQVHAVVAGDQSRLDLESTSADNARADRQPRPLSR
jgi:hypothetical protein